MSEEKIVLTRDGYEKLQRELETLLTEESAEVNEQLADAMEDADTGDEAAFYDAVSSKEWLRQRILELQRILARATIIEADPDPERAGPGNRVTVWDETEKEELRFDLLSSHEIAHGRQGVSTESPVGKALIGRKVGETVEVEVPMGTVRYKIRKIEMIPQE